MAILAIPVHFAILHRLCYSRHYNSVNMSW